MKKSIKIGLLILILAIATSLGLFAAGSKETTKGVVWPTKDKLHVGFSQADLKSTWRTVESDHMRQIANERGYKLTIVNAEGDIERQISGVESLLAQGCNVIVIVPLDADAVLPAHDAAAAKGVPVIVKARGSNGIPGVDFVTEVLSDFVWQGEQAGKWIKDAAIKKGLSKVRVAEIQGVIGGTDVRDRSQGFHNITDTSGDMFEFVSQQSANWSRTEAQELTQNILQATGGKIDAIFCQNDEMALGAYLALQQAGKVVNKDIFLVGIDGMIEALDAIKEGKMSATVTCTPKFADTVFDIIEDGMAGKAIAELVIVPDKLVDINNVEEFYALGF